MVDLDALIERMNRGSRRRVLLDRVDEAKRAIRAECGNCSYWMKSRSCPMERNVSGRSRGPSAGDPPCGSYSEDARKTRPGAERFRDAVYALAVFDGQGGSDAG